MAGKIMRETRDSIAMLTLHNPSKKNALDPQMLGELVNHLDDIAGSPTACACVLTGSGDVFCAGYDLDALDGSETEGQSAYTRAIEAVSNCPVPIIAALNGHAVGGGCELAVACDLRVGHAGLLVRMPPVRLGLVYPRRGLARFVALIGLAHAKQLFLLGERVKAARAHEWGLIDELVEPDQVLPQALAMAKSISRGVPDAVRATRAVFQQLIPSTSIELEAATAKIAAQIWKSDAAKAARVRARKKD